MLLQNDFEPIMIHVTVQPLTKCGLKHTGTEVFTFFFFADDPGLMNTTTPSSSSTFLKRRASRTVVQQGESSSTSSSAASSVIMSGISVSGAMGGLPHGKSGNGGALTKNQHPNLVCPYLFG